MREILQKQPPLVNDKYRAWVCTWPCCNCGAVECVDPHHIRASGFSGGVKPPDYLCIPLCRTCHSELHQMGHKSWEAHYGTAESWHCNRQLMRAIYAGILVFSAENV